ncbi:MAG: SpoIID/LytB domain-containing protein [Leptospiraceae bacterium]|nr:SpoIID/LytB domain-containing protein [Leptospiraceae bacterium]
MRIIISILIFSMFSGCSTLFGTRKWEAPAGKNFQNLRVRLDLTNSNILIKTDSKYVLLEKDKKVVESEKQYSLDPESLKVGDRITLNFQNNKFTYRNKTYRGNLELYKRAFGIQVVNIIPLEDYLLSVVPSEMPASWPLEALKAQSVAARTYAVYNVMYPKFDDYHLESDVKSQMYSGVSRETVVSSMAVKDTRGEILIAKDQLVQAFYHSNSGGVTETPDYVWGNKLEYLVSINSDYCKDSQAYSWKARLSKDIITTKLDYLGVGEVEDISIKEFTPSKRAYLLEVKGKEGTKKVRGQEFRMKISPMKIRSLLFKISKSGDNFDLEGYGFGHGVGMSQWGAYNMAKLNLNYKEILNFYYKKVEILGLPEN